jgi:hypothetical protein
MNLDQAFPSNPLGLRLSLIRQRHSQETMQTQMNRKWLSHGLHQAPMAALL